MKKLISLLLVLTMAVGLLAACGGNGGETTTGPKDTTGAVDTTGAPDTTGTPDTTAGTTGTEADSLEAIVDGIFQISPVEFMMMPTRLDLTDTSEDGMWMLKSATGLDSAELITEAIVAEPMIGSIPFSLVLVRVADEANAETVAETMKQNIDPRKWICVEANDIQVSGCGDLVMFIMTGNEELPAQSFTDAFASVAGELDFTY